MASETRGVRNFNPGNIERGKDPWQGLASRSEMNAAQQAETRFAVFQAPEWGIRALARVLISYQDKYGLNTIQGIINRWAPPVENATVSYVAAVAKAVGVGAGDRIDVHDYGDAEPLVTAIIAHENAGYAYPQATIDKGLMLAGIEPPTKKVVNKTADKAKTVAVIAGGGTALMGTMVDGLQQMAPAVPILRDISSLPWWMLVLGALAAGGGVAVWLANRHR